MFNINFLMIFIVELFISTYTFSQQIDTTTYFQLSNREYHSLYCS